MHPLPDTHPELSVSFAASGVLELRVENWTLRQYKDGQKRKPPESPRNLLVTVCVAYVLFRYGSPTSFISLFIWSCAASLYLYSKCTQVLHESMLLLPLYGIQLETHRGLKPPFLPVLPLTASRRFIPLTSVRDVVINEGLHRWDVRYYICIIRDIGSEVTLEVAFENIMPQLPILEVVYSYTHELLRNSKSSSPKSCTDVCAHEEFLTAAALSSVIPKRLQRMGNNILDDHIFVSLVCFGGSATWDLKCNWGSGYANTSR